MRPHRSNQVPSIVDHDITFHPPNVYLAMYQLQYTRFIWGLQSIGPLVNPNPGRAGIGGGLLAVEFDFPNDMRNLTGNSLLD